MTSNSFFRESWGNPEIPGEGTKLAFLLGTLYVVEIYHTVNRLRSFLSLGYLVTRSLSHLYFQSCDELTN